MASTFYLNRNGLAGRAIWERWGPHPRDFGAVADGVTDDTDALNKWAEFIQDQNRWAPSDQYTRVSWEGEYAISGTIDLSRTSVSSGGPKVINGDIKLIGCAGGVLPGPAGTMRDGSVQNANRRFMVYTNNQRGELYSGHIHMIANPNMPLWDDPDRANGFQVGWWRANSREQKFVGGITVEGFAMHGLYDSTGNMSLSYFDTIRAFECGSGGGNATSTDNLSVSGTATNVANYDTNKSQVTIDTFPPAFYRPNNGTWNADMRTYIRFHDRNEVYRVFDSTTWDIPNGTIVVSPWLRASTKAAITGGGLGYSWIFGGGIFQEGADDNVHLHKRVYAVNCGIAHQSQPLYEPIVKQSIYTGCGIGSVHAGGSAGLGGRWDNYLVTDTYEHVRVTNNTIETGYRIFTGYADLDFTKVHGDNERRLNDSSEETQFVFGSFPQEPMTYKGYTMQAEGTTLEYAGSSRNASWRWDALNETVYLSNSYTFTAGGDNSNLRAFQEQFSNGMRSSTCIGTSVHPTGSIDLSIAAAAITAGYTTHDGVATETTWTHKAIKDFPTDVPTTTYIFRNPATKKYYLGFDHPRHLQRSEEALTSSSSTPAVLLPWRHCTVQLTAASPTLTIPTDLANADLLPGFRCSIFPTGASGVTLSTTGVTMYGVSSAVQNQRLDLEKVASDTWLATVKIG